MFLQAVMVGLYGVNEGKIMEREAFEAKVREIAQIGRYVVMFMKSL